MKQIALILLQIVLIMLILAVPIASAHGTTNTLKYGDNTTIPGAIQLKYPFGGQSGNCVVPCWHRSLKP